MNKAMGRAAAVAALFVAQATLASAAEIKVFSTVGVKSVLEDLIPKFEKASGHKLAITWSTAALLTKRVQAGEQADALILIKGDIETWRKDAKASRAYQVARASISCSASRQPRPVRYTSRPGPCWIHGAR